MMPIPPPAFVTFMAFRKTSFVTFFPSDKLEPHTIAAAVRSRRSKFHDLSCGIAILEIEGYSADRLGFREVLWDTT